LAYRSVVFLHVVFVLGLCSALVVEWTTLSGMRGTREAEPFRAWGRQLMFIERFHPLWGIGILGTGIYLTTSAWTWTTPFVLGGLVATVVSAVLGAAVNGPKFRSIVAAGDALSGSVPAAAREQAGAASLRMVHGAQSGVALALFYIMLVKPDWTGCIVSLVAGAGVGLALGAKLGAPRNVGEGKAMP